jgi:Tol biopolymer transport system component
LTAAAAACAFLAGAVTGGERASTAATPTEDRAAQTQACRDRAAGQTQRVDVGTNGEEANGRSWRGTISANGRVVAFTSTATNLVRRDTNRARDVFVRDLRTHRTVRVSVSSAGTQANRSSFYPALSADGRIIAFRSLATNLVRGDHNGVADVFVHDLATGLTERVSVASAGAEASAGSFSSSVSADGRIVAFSSSASNLDPDDHNGVTDVFVRDRARRQTVRVTVGPYGEGNGRSEGSSISANGRVVAFRSFATNLVAGDTNGLADAFVRDWARRVTERVNVSSWEGQANRETFRPMLSGDGRRVGFRSRAVNLVRGDTNEALDVFVRDRVAGTTTRVSVASDGSEADAQALSWMAGQTIFMSRPYLSADGRYAAFSSRAANLVLHDRNGVSDVFVHDLLTLRTVRVTVTADGAEADGPSFVSGISGDGRVVVFQSSADNLVKGDTNLRRDTFVRIRAIDARCR